MTTLSQQTIALPQKLIGGIIGGVAGGIVFGIMMGVMGMMPMIAVLVGSESALVGFIVHMAISVFIGGTFGLLLGGFSANLVSGPGFGALYGLVWWILGPLLIMPAMMGMPLFMFNQMTMMSLLGHLIFGAVAGLAYAWYVSRP